MAHHQLLNNNSEDKNKTYFWEQILRAEQIENKFKNGNKISDNISAIVIINDG